VDRDWEWGTVKLAQMERGKKEYAIPS